MQSNATSRRAFLKTSTAVAAGAASGLLARPWTALAGEEEPRPEAGRQEAVLKLCSQEHIVPGRNIQEKAAKILRWGGCGLEFGGIDARRAEQIRKELDGTGVSPAALCWGSCNGDLVSPDGKRQNNGIAALKHVLEAAGVLGSTGVIWVPCFNGQSHLKPSELDKILHDILPAIGEYAVRVKARVLIEPLNKGETFYINRLEQAAAICRDVNSPGICMMGDFYHMSKEEKSQQAAFVTGGARVHHVHLATGKSRILPGQEPHSYVDGFKGLQRIGYHDFCSLECGVRGDRDVEIPKGFAFLKRQWEEAKG